MLLQRKQFWKFFIFVDIRNIAIPQHHGPQSDESSTDSDWNTMKFNEKLHQQKMTNVEGHGRHGDRLTVTKPNKKHRHNCV